MFANVETCFVMLMKHVIPDRVPILFAQEMERQRLIDVDVGPKQYVLLVMSVFLGLLDLVLHPSVWVTERQSRIVASADTVRPAVLERHVFRVVLVYVKYPIV